MDEYEVKYVKKKEKPKYSKIIVAMVISLNVVFTAAVLYIFLKTQAEPVTLTGCWFAFTTGELWMLSSIKKKETKTKKDEENL